jgi:hypothetical protein
LAVPGSIAKAVYVSCSETANASLPEYTVCKKRNLPNVTLLTINDFTLNASCIFALQQAKTSPQNPNLGALVAG